MIKVKRITAGSLRVVCILLLALGGSCCHGASPSSTNNSNNNNNNNNSHLAKLRLPRRWKYPESLAKISRTDKHQRYCRKLSSTTSRALFWPNSLHQNTQQSTLALAVSSIRGGGGTGGDATKILSFGNIYLLSLLGSSVGFYSFLYFISVGYALGITLPLLAALSTYQTHFQSLQVLPLVPRPNVDTATLLHTTLVIVWGFRALGFFLWREFVNWPALHKQIRFVHESNAPRLSVKTLIWMSYSCLYTAMASSCWFRLQSSLRVLLRMNQGSSSSSSRGFGTGLVRLGWTMLPFLLQTTGLVMESLADYQKSQFKWHSRYEWCHEGLWRWSTHPNYLGEMLFWTGTYLGWLLFAMRSSIRATHTRLSWWGQFVVTTIGYIFITTVLRGSIHSMGLKHWQKYGHIPEYATFRQTHGLVGPKRRSIIVSSQNGTDTTNSSPVDPDIATSEDNKEASKNIANTKDKAK